jgi:RNA polymerase sigma factor (sigma-70 family)
MKRISEILTKLSMIDDSDKREKLADEAASLCSPFTRQMSRNFIAKHRLPTIVDADDLAQEADLRLLHAFRQQSFSITSEEHLARYLNRTVTNVARDLVRWASAEKRGGGEGTLSLLSDVADSNLTPDEREMYGEAIDAAQAWLASLSEQDRCLIHLKFGKESTFAEVAERLKMPFSKTYRRYRELVDRLEAELSEYL